MQVRRFGAKSRHVAHGITQSDQRFCFPLLITIHSAQAGAIVQSAINPQSRKVAARMYCFNFRPRGSETVEHAVVKQRNLKRAARYVIRSNADDFLSAPIREIRAGIINRGSKDGR